VLSCVHCFRLAFFLQLAGQSHKRSTVCLLLCNSHTLSMNVIACQVVSVMRTLAHIMMRFHPGTRCYHPDAPLAGGLSTRPGSVQSESVIGCGMGPPPGDRPHES
jgi:hypothetical protein